MMKMHIWDREKGSEGSQSIDKVSISSGLVKLLVALSNKFYFSNFEISLNDYELLETKQLEVVINELKQLCGHYPEYKNEIELLVEKILLASELNKDILFDPF